MAIRTATTPARAGERSRSPAAQVGPVTAAIRAVRAEDMDQERDRIAELREGLGRYFAGLGPDEGRAFDALLAQGEL
ncbi:hypothetical protein OPKNFCMD_5483 [Methylobacterium crusticola]|uniref:Uncharacterized protein n=1 Tax=Methylobacterium crusticola TaxID=1697972 RepID=A0ABQ4R7G1_9HYPH|nr:hypothetical protein [Methylobacterium crusticola]GJD52716.1 hypothetical protein OPKNFCMD_5483 [Methylobacterium crusticola]